MRKSLFLFCFIAAVAAYPAGLHAQEFVQAAGETVTGIIDSGASAVESIFSVPADIISAFGAIIEQRRTYTPPIDLTEVLSAQY